MAEMDDRNPPEELEAGDGVPAAAGSKRQLDHQPARTDADETVTGPSSTDQQAKYAKMEAENKKLKQQLLALSVKGLLESMPKMRVNPECRPSITPNTRLRKMFVTYRDAMQRWSTNGKRKKERPKRPRQHEPAKIIYDDDVKKYVNQCKINVEDGDGNLITSRLATLQRAADNISLLHSNETSPQDYLSDALTDVLRCLGIKGVVVKEASLFAMRPDLVVVLVFGLLLLVSEIKNPGVPHSDDDDSSDSDDDDSSDSDDEEDNNNQDEDDEEAKRAPCKDDSKESVFTAESAAGQTLNYSYGVRQSGIDHPVALLSTYNETVLARLNGDSEIYHKYMKEAVDSMSTRARERHTRHQDEVETKNDKPAISPIKKALAGVELSSLSVTLTNAEQATLTNAEQADAEEGGMDKEEPSDATNDADGDDNNFDYQGREIVYSTKTFDTCDLYKVLALALETNMIAMCESKGSANPLVPPQSSSIPKREIATIYSRSCGYTKVEIDNVSYNVPPDFKEMEKIYVFCVLGQGGRGRCILCGSASGNMFVAKLFLLTPSTHYRAENRKKANKNEYKKKKKLANEEKKMWLNLAPECQKKYCTVRRMNNIPALTMPYFPMIPQEQRPAAIGLITECLNRLYTKGFVYGEIWWRHFGWRKSGDTMEITPLDLGSLRKIEESDPHDIVQQQIEGENGLRSRMGESIEGPKPPLMGQN